MPIQFPGGIDVFPTRAAGVVIEGQHMNDVQAGLTAAMAKLGVDNSLVTSSIDYLLTNVNSSNPGHKHTGLALSDIAEATITRPGTPILARLASNEIVTGAWRFNSQVTLAASMIFHSGYATLPSGGMRMVLGAGGLTPDAASITWGDSTGWKLHFGTAAPTFKQIMTLVDTGRVGINTAAPVTALQVSDVTVVTDFASIAQRGVLSIVGPSATNQINALTFLNAANDVIGKIATVRRAGGVYELRLAPSDGSALASWVTIDSAAGMAVGDLASQLGTLGWSLEVLSSGLSSQQGIRNLFAASNITAPEFRFQKTRGSLASASPLGGSDRLGAIYFDGNHINGSAPAFVTGAQIVAHSEQAFLSTDTGTHLRISATLTGTTGVTEAMRIGAAAVSLGGASMNAELQMRNVLGRKLVLWENTNSNDDIYGWILAAGVLRHQVPPASTHLFYAGANPKMRIDATGTVFGDTSVASIADLEIKGSWAVGKVRQITVTSIGQQFHNVDVSGVSIIEILDGTGGTIANQPFYITGLANGARNQRIIIRNTTAGQLSLKLRNASSTSGNRILGYQAGDLQITGNLGGLCELWKADGGAAAAPWVLLYQTAKSVQ